MNKLSAHQGRFIVFEGGEGAGKSTQVKALVARLRAQGLEVVQTREPGGSPGAEALRDLLVRGDATRWSPMSELLMMYAARADHLEKVIRPALERGAWVVCDRFADSSRAYQGAGGGVAPAFIEQVDEAVVGHTQPDLVLVLDMPVEAGLRRAHGRGDAENRFESKGVVFHERLRAGFLKRAAQAPDRYRVIDADREIEAISAEIWSHVHSAFADLRGA
ncbi:thymidylate kinase [Asticcacaulis sp. AC466]|uniref:dTMP kinase n=1 Tax=Asticcacaulis sp. AC466 TaxID=1282362 RepID=UPI0003C3CB3C|nr:dTMP kinase [Asticcacaulis sp. AC466]ESQ84269.1 thymidylate kinase [Asticcacaulis sp. AC466]